MYTTCMYILYIYAIFVLHIMTQAFELHRPALRRRADREVAQRGLADALACRTERAVWAGMCAMLGMQQGCSYHILDTCQPP